MLLYQSVPLHSLLMWLGVLAGLMLLNELARSNKWIGLAMFVVFPAAMTVLVWPTTAGPGTSMNDWFHWAKVYSALAGSLGFMAIRFIKGLDKNKYALAFPALILAVNILEAIVRDFQCYSLDGIVGGILTVGGPWNVMNGIAGILNIVTITGWMGIFIAKGKKKDMLWPDMLWFWIVAYDLWNFAYTYNCIGDHSFYAGLALLLSCTIPAFFIRKGAWLQHRAQTLAIWCMFAMTYPSFIDESNFAVKASGNPKALFAISLLALLANVAVFAYWLYKIVKDKKNPFKTEVFSDLEAYKKIAIER